MTQREALSNLHPFIILCAIKISPNRLSSCSKRQCITCYSTDSSSVHIYKYQIKAIKPVRHRTQNIHHLIILIVMITANFLVAQPFTFFYYCNSKSIVLVSFLSFMCHVMLLIRSRAENESWMSSALIAVDQSFSIF